MNLDDVAKLVVILVLIGGSWTAIIAMRAWARRIGRETSEPAQLTELQETVQRLSGEVAELQERLDFAERLLAQQRDAALPKPRP